MTYQPFTQLQKLVKILYVLESWSQHNLKGFILLSQGEDALNHIISSSPNSVIAEKLSAPNPGTHHKKRPPCLAAFCPLDTDLLNIVSLSFVGGGDKPNPMQPTQHQAEAT